MSTTRVSLFVCDWTLVSLVCTISIASCLCFSSDAKIARLSDWSAELLVTLRQHLSYFFQFEVRGEAEYRDGPETDELAALFVAAHVVEVQRKGDRTDRCQHGRAETVGTDSFRSFYRRLFSCITHTFS